jgi:hypothetical protein
MIVEEEQQGKERAEYGAFLIQNLAVRLSKELAGVFRSQACGIWASITGAFQFSPHCGEN